MSEFYVDELDGDLEESVWLSRSKQYEGKYHFFIDEVIDPETPREEKESERTGEVYTDAEAVQLQLRVLAPAELAGKRKTWYLKRTGWKAKITGLVAKMFGLVTNEQVKAAREAGEPIVIDWSSIAGRDFCAELKLNEWISKADGSAQSELRVMNFCLPSEAKERGWPVDESSLYDDGVFDGPKSEDLGL